ncbi:tetratricopeptide repeat protein [Hydrogenobacter hydrogenophilus]|nr:tetratricopeptide repeat protein [Hydrogenobacter hydrogenophilus]
MRYYLIRIVPLVLALLVVMGGFWGLKWWKDKKLSELSYQEYEIRRAIQSGDYKRADELIKKIQADDSPYKPLVLSYRLYLEKEEGIKVDEVQILQDLISSLKDKDIVPLYKERLAYAYYLVGNNQKALELLNNIGKDSFNYYSAQILKGMVLEKMGKKDQAKEVYTQVEKLAKGTYFGNLAGALLMEER